MLLWTIRIAVCCYLLRILIGLRSGSAGFVAHVPSRAELLFWTVGCAFYVAHVICAFAFVHDWSHARAWEHTAIATEQVTGIRRGEGVWVNYFFSLVWIADVIRLVIARHRSAKTNPVVDRWIQGFFAFIVFNATIVFGPPAYRWMGIPVAVGMGLVFVLNGKVKLSR